MAAEKHSEPVTIVRADGSTVTLKRVRAEDWRITFRNEFRAARKLLLIEDLALGGVPRTEWVKRLDALNQRLIRLQDLVRWVDDPVGQYTALRLSLAIDNPAATNDDVTALDLTDEQLHEAAAAVLGMTLVKPGELPLPEPAAANEASAGNAPSSAAA